ncbi:hypothetical protein [Micromonospora sp. CPCC 205558]|uniref:hypothetical protein n=1 Tax=Micromonospora sp. CPCC 205558 TaxID=3122403 RepID=UPI002FF145A2
MTNGESAVQCHRSGLSLRQVDEMLAQVQIVAGLLDSYAPDACQALSRRDARRR